MDVIANCQDKIIPSQYDIEGEGSEAHYVCSKCNEGMRWDQYKRECESCGEFSEWCNECDSEKCLECTGGYMLSPDSTDCVEKISNCEGSPVQTQPQGLTDSYGNWTCDQCEKGFWWDDCLCRGCSMHGCLSCSNDHTCEECQPGMILELDESLCIPVFENCKASEEMQPAGLERNWDLGKYECSICLPGFYKNFEGRCKPCESAIYGCLECSSERECTTCSGVLQPNGAQCEMPTPIRGCEIMN